MCERAGKSFLVLKKLMKLQKKKKLNFFLFRFPNIEDRISLHQVSKSKKKKIYADAHLSHATWYWVKN